MLCLPIKIMTFFLLESEVNSSSSSICPSLSLSMPSAPMAPIVATLLFLCRKSLAKRPSWTKLKILTGACASICFKISDIALPAKAVVTSHDTNTPLKSKRTADKIKDWMANTRLRFFIWNANEILNTILIFFFTFFLKKSYETLKMINSFTLQLTKSE